MNRGPGDGPAAMKPQLFLDTYREVFAPFLHKPVRLLELGIHEGGSLLEWEKQFPHGMIAGLDMRPVKLEAAGDRVRIYQGQQEDTRLLDRIAQETAPDGFDIIIDDCSHLAEYTRVSFWHLFDRHLKPGGIYVIEDWGTGFWASWPDGEKYSGANHLAGMVGFVKELVDECGRADMTDPWVAPADTVPPAHSRFSHMRISLGQVFVFKAAASAVSAGA